MEDLLNKKEFINATNLHKFRMELAAGLLMKITGLSNLNKLYLQIAENQDFSFIEKLLDELNIQIDINEVDFENIPKEGAFVTVSNHPFGMLDGILLLYLVASRRPDFKVVANFLLKKIGPIENFFIPVNPFDGSSGSLGGMREALKHLDTGKPIGIFPAGEVASLHPKGEQIISDRQWQLPSMKLVKKARVPVVPIYFKGGNSVVFQLLGLIHPMLRTATLASEFLKKKNATIKVRIGRPISVADQDRFVRYDNYARYLRAKTYSLNASLDVKKFYLPKFSDLRRAMPICEKEPQDLIEKEIESIKNQLILEKNNFRVYISRADEIPHILKELGRLREITFREVGEGTNKERDLDAYDLYYQHLFVWDTLEKEIIAAYRIGRGMDIMQRYGKRGFYIHSLFKIDDEFNPYLEKSLELGRSFVVKKHQKKPLPLFLLWKGILHHLMHHPEYLYIIGPVSISNSYSRLSKNLLVAYIKKFHYNKELARFIKARKNFKLGLKRVDSEILMEGMDKNTFTQIDKTIAGIEPFHLSIPVLLKKYIKENAEIIGFNVDPHFNNSLDGLMILDLKNLNSDMVEKLNKEMKEESQNS
ncbi:lysophospholipid acyltransferase family protein [Hyphobacterium sp. CCMP332]|nr:lysophospholipid acyltransferase family protein [Hyphobacterium sp. CCMP332]